VFTIVKKLSRIHVPVAIVLLHMYQLPIDRLWFLTIFGERKQQQQQQQMS